MAALMTALPPTTVLPELQKPFLALDNEKRVIRQRFRKTHHDYTICFGHKAFTYPASCGTIIGWSITGHLAHTVTNIQKTILDLLGQKLQDLRTPTKHYAIRCYMLGCKKSRAAPHVVALCSDERFSQSLKTIIIDSNILPERWYFFRLPYDVVTLTMPQPLSILSEDIGQYKVFVPGDTVPQYLNAISIEIWKDDQYIGTATIGGMIEVGGQAFALTVAHVFCSTRPPEPEPEHFMIDESELGFLRSDTESDFTGLNNDCSGDSSDDNSESSEDGDWKWGSTSSPLFSSSSGALLNEVSLSEPTPTSGGKILIGHLSHISDIKGHAMKDFPNLDWALISLEHPTISRHNKRGTNGDSISSSNLGTVIISRPSSDDNGRFLQDSFFGLPTASSPQPVLTVKTDTFEMGDSGSWMLQPGTENVLGMLIGACPLLGETYFLRIEDIWNDVEHQIGMKASISSKDGSVSSANEVKDQSHTSTRLPLNQDPLLEVDIAAPSSDTSNTDAHTQVEKGDSNNDKMPARAQRLKRKIEERLLFSDKELGGQRFLPQDRANDLLMKDDIVLELEAAGLTPDEWLVDAILRRAAKIFLTLVWIENIQAIKELLQNGMDDQRLPIQLAKAYDRKGDVYWVVSSSEWPVFRTSTLSHIEAFADNQWLFLAPVFGDDTFWYDLDEECPLPFLQPEKQIIDQDNFTKIYQTELHSAHQKQVRTP